MSTWWWLSFCDGDKPEGSQFLGCAIVRGGNIGEAAFEAHRLSCNPGGEVAGMPFPDHVIMPEGATNRLLTRAEAEAIDDELGRLNRGH